MIDLKKIHARLQERREWLWYQLQEGGGGEKSALILIADFEQTKQVFRQESSFYYLTGITEPGSIAVLFPGGDVVLYVPQYATARDRWVKGSLVAAAPQSSEALRNGVREIRYLGDACPGYFLTQRFDPAYYSNLLRDLVAMHAEGYTFFSLFVETGSRYLAQELLLSQLIEALGDPDIQVINAGDEVHRMRKSKDIEEVALICSAINVTGVAHEAVAQLMRPGMAEYELQACIESVFTQFGSMGPAFPSIVATGKNTTVLHYTDRRHYLREGDLVVIDIGAEFDYYAADITRTYPVSGMFSARQQEVYDMVLGAQQYIESCVRPGMYLNNANYPDQSLQHLAIDYFRQYGIAQYFIHGIGHYLGLDVHDVGSYQEPLKEGDVITIEPGIYLPEEAIGVRIEDNYAIAEDGLVCLSAAIIKEPGAIEQLMNATEEEE